MTAITYWVTLSCGCVVVMDEAPDVLDEWTCAAHHDDSVVADEWVAISGSDDEPVVNPTLSAAAARRPEIVTDRDAENGSEATA